MEKALSVITLNVNGLNSLIKRQSLVVGKKYKPNYILPHETVLDPKKQIDLKGGKG